MPDPPQCLSSCASSQHLWTSETQRVNLMVASSRVTSTQYSHSIRTGLRAKKVASPSLRIQHNHVVCRKRAVVVQL